MMTTVFRIVVVGGYEEGIGIGVVIWMIWILTLIEVLSRRRTGALTLTGGLVGIAIPTRRRRKWW